MIRKPFVYVFVCLLAFYCSSGFTERVSPEQKEFLYGVFPEDFMWGVGSASYQVEGAWDEDGKSENIWDNFTHNISSPIKDQSNGDIAGDSYHKYKEDVQLLKELGVDFYRLSISWTRLFPDARTNETNMLGIKYYNDLINELMANNIQPFVTLYHWDLPQILQEAGGWQNEETAYRYVEYAKVVFENYGDRVKLWLTFNEPWTSCALGYANGQHAPGIKEPAVPPYLCAHNILKAHAMTYRMYEKDFKPSQKGKLGITLDSSWYEADDLDDPEHHAAAERYLNFRHSWFAYPIVYGEYSPLMRSIMDERSENESLPESRLPSFDNEWTSMLNGSLDFLGVNHYSTELSSPDHNSYPGYFTDIQTKTRHDPEWPESASSWLKCFPYGMRRFLGWIRDTYGDWDLYITENGWTDDGTNGLEDPGRIEYHKLYINEMLKAVQLDGVNVKGYTAWSLIDLFEWSEGYTEKFGLYRVNFSDPERPRYAKDSAAYMTQLYANNGFPEPSNDTSTLPPTTDPTPTTTVATTPAAGSGSGSGSLCFSLLLLINVVGILFIKDL